MTNCNAIPMTDDCSTAYWLPRILKLSSAKSRRLARKAQASVWLSKYINLNATGHLKQIFKLVHCDIFNAEKNNKAPVKNEFAHKHKNFCSI